MCLDGAGLLVSRGDVEHDLRQPLGVEPQIRTELIAGIRTGNDGSICLVYTIYTYESG